MAVEGKALTAGDYITHHLVHLQNKKQVEIIDFSVFNLDSLFWSISLGLTAVLFMAYAARRVHSGVPGRLQGLVEMLVELVDTQAKGIVHNETSRRAVSAAAAAPYAERLLALPAFLVPGRSGTTEGAGGRDSRQAVLDGFALTGHFLENRLFAQLHAPLPLARARLLDILLRA